MQKLENALMRELLRGLFVPVPEKKIFGLPIEI